MSEATIAAEPLQLDADNLAKFQKHYDVPEGDTDLAKLLERVQPDLVSICTFVGSHVPIFDIVKTARPKGILMEKPFALCMDDIRRMTDESAELGIKFAINHFRRLVPSFAKTRDLLDEGAIGEVQMITTAVDSPSDRPIQRGSTMFPSTVLIRQIASAPASAAARAT